MFKHLIECIIMSFNYINLQLIMQFLMKLLDICKWIISYSTYKIRCKTEKKLR